MPRAKENRLLAWQLAVEKLFAHSNLAEDVRARRAVKARTTRLVGRERFSPGTQFEPIESPRMNNRMTANGETLRPYFLQVSKVPSEKERSTVGIAYIFRLNEKCTLNKMLFFH